MTSFWTHPPDGRAGSKDRTQVDLRNGGAAEMSIQSVLVLTDNSWDFL